ncbi:S41 family peptidase [Pelagicoccus mobilis]|uniref:Tail specific protease domain-containing protein n=1 Tax=Pelagicoccus mobilis TaxID=415221 RepID=A0A934VJJ6_9BACT|nr:S41 family peptidase [Pelagicoccus mobilis]MBK1875691.1 hypothetical protein [Pelagicoccus mobilis]
MRKIVHCFRVILFIGFLWGAGSHLWGDSEGLFVETFEAAWSQVGKTYYDANFGGLDWDEVGERYRAKVKKATDMDEVRRLISSMLYELGESHLALLSAGGSEEYALVPWTGGWAGVDLCYRKEALVFYRVDREGAGYEAGIRSGDTLLSVDGRTVKQFKRSARKSGLPKHTLRYSVLATVLSHFRGGVGDELSLVVKGSDGRRRTLDLTLGRYVGRTSEPLGRIGRMPLELELKRLESGAGYVRFNFWFPAVMPQIREFIQSLPPEADGLVIDLRGNPGGVMLMAGGIAGMLLDEQAELGRTTLREGHMNVVGFPQNGRFLGKVAVLVDEASVSTSEVFAIGMQELGRVRVFGQRTPGAALPSVIVSLPSGDSLQIALGDFKTPQGVTLEGRGVTPDEIVTISPVDLSQGEDSVLSAALDWIHQTQTL